jgi:hypothetical protein
MTRITSNQTASLAATDHQSAGDEVYSVIVDQVEQRPGGLLGRIARRLLYERPDVLFDRPTLVRIADRLDRLPGPRQAGALLLLVARHTAGSGRPNTE